MEASVENREDVIIPRYLRFLCFLSLSLCLIRIHQRQRPASNSTASFASSTTIEEQSERAKECATERIFKLS